MGLFSTFFTRDKHGIYWAYPGIYRVKLAEWVARNLVEELRLPDTGNEWSSEDLNLILTCSIDSDRLGDNLHTFHSVEFESDLYHGVMGAQYYPFEMAQHRFRGKNIKVCQFHPH